MTSSRASPIDYRKPEDLIKRWLNTSLQLVYLAFLALVLKKFKHVLSLNFSIVSKSIC